MTRDQALAFSERAAQTRADLFGVTALWNGEIITITVAPVSSLSLAEGGYENEGRLKGYTLAQGLKIHDRLTIGGKVWRVVELQTAEHTVEVAVTLERNK
jgi:hypothetical protein